MGLPRKYHKPGTITEPKLAGNCEEVSPSQTLFGRQK